MRAGVVDPRNFRQGRCLSSFPLERDASSVEHRWGVALWPALSGPPSMMGSWKRPRCIPRTQESLSGFSGPGLEHPRGLSLPSAPECRVNKFFTSPFLILWSENFSHFKAASIHISRSFTWVHITVPTPLSNYFTSCSSLRGFSGIIAQETSSSYNIQVIFQRKTSTWTLICLIICLSSVDVPQTVDNFDWNYSMRDKVLICKDKNLENISKRCGYRLKLMSVKKIQTFIK